MAYKIGSLRLDNPYFLAPMVEINDIAFRLLCKNSGASLTYTGMINPLSKQKLNLEDKPAIQIFTKNTRGISDFIDKYEKKASLFDFNLGCPAKNARKLKFGAFMHHKLKDIGTILKKMHESTSKPVTIKLRKSKHANKIIKIAENYCSAVTIHPRTIQQGYSGEPDIRFAEKIKKNTNLPVIYSGNVDEKNYKKLIKKFDFLMIGRQAFGNPNIFARLTGKKTDYNFFDWLKMAKKYNIYFRQIKFQAMKFTRFHKNAAEFRNELVKAKTEKQIIEIMKKLD